MTWSDCSAIELDIKHYVGVFMRSSFFVKVSFFVVLKKPKDENLKIRYPIVSLTSNHEQFIKISACLYHVAEDDG